MLTRLVVRGYAAANRRDFDVLLLGLDPEIEYRPSDDLTPPDLEAVFYGHIGLWRCTKCGNDRPPLDVACEELQSEVDTITLAIRTGPAGAMLGGNLMGTLNGGLVTFSNLSLQTAGNYTLQATSGIVPALPAVNSASFVIAPAGLDHQTFTVQPANTVAGQVLATVQVTFFDAFGNVETGDFGDEY